MTGNIQRPFVSPTVKWRYEENPSWTAHKGMRQQYGFGTSKNEDIKGYDLEGFNDRGVDRAGYSAADYASNPRYQGVVVPIARQLCRGYQLLVPLRTGLDLTDRVMSVLIDVYPEAEVRDLDGRDPAAAAYGTSMIVRGFSASGEIYAGLYATGPEGERHIYFQCDQMTALNRDIGKPYSMSCNISDPQDIEEWGRHHSYTSLSDLDEVEDAVRHHLTDFMPYVLEYAICIVDGETEPLLEAVPLNGDEGQEFAGDRIGRALGHDEAQALSNFLASGNVRTRALAEMTERGIAALEPGVVAALGN